MANRSSGACAPCSASGRTRSSDVGSAQCRSSNATDGGLGSRPRENPGCHCRKLPSPQLFRRELRGPAWWQRDVNKRRKQRRMFGWVQAEQNQRVFEVGEALLSGSIQAKPLPAPFGDRVQRRVLQKLRGRSIRPRYAEFPQSRAWNSSISRDLPRPGSPTIWTNWPSPARARSQRRASRLQFLFAADERRQGPRAASPPAAARADDAKELQPARLRL